MSSTEPDRAGTSHVWLRGGRRTDRLARLDHLGLPEPLLPERPVLDAHGRRRGPYTLFGTVLRGVVPVALERWPELVAAHEIAILTAAPELRDIVPATRETLTSLAIPAERTRFYSRLRTLRIAHGLAEFLRDHAAGLGKPRCLVIEELDHADPTDVEAVGVLVRRVDPAVLRVVIGTGSDQLPEAPTAPAAPHLAVVEAFTGGEPGPAPEGDLVAAYVADECLTDDPRSVAAYDAADPARRAALHDARADELEATGELTWRLGAVPYHRERGADPKITGVRALRFALDYCIDNGFYDVTVELGVRGRALVTSAANPEFWWAFTTKMTTSLGAVSRPEEAEALYDEARAVSTSASVHMQAAYATAMLYTRHHDEPHRDHQLARGWINQAIAFASQIQDPRERAFQSAFHRNGLALIEVHQRKLPAALELVNWGLESLDEALGASGHALHRSVLRHNRANVYGGLGRLEEALADFTAVIELDPNYSEYYFDRANLLRRMDRHDDALVDYEHAMRLSPPYPEVFYNRADIRRDQGDDEGALADLDYVLDLDPDHVDARLNRAGLLLELGAAAAAERDVVAGLAVDPANAALHCLEGQLALLDEDLDRAEAAFTRATEADPTYQPAWVGRATTRFAGGAPAAALAHLDRAAALADDAAVLFNRALVLRALDRYTEARQDLERAAVLAPDDPDVLSELRAAAA